MNMSLTKNNNIVLSLSTYAVVILGSFIIYGYVFPTSNHFMEVPPILSMMDPELYTRDYYVREMIQFTPRYYYSQLIALTMKLGFSLSGAYLLYYVIAFISFVTGLFAIASIFSPSKLTGAILAFLCLEAVTGRIAGDFLFVNTPQPAIFAMGFTIWGIYFCLQKKWVWAYTLFGLASLLQFLVGIIPGFLWFLLMVMDCYGKKKIKHVLMSAAIFSAMASFVYVPMRVMGNTSSGVISDAELVYLYGYMRHPHHIIPSAWGAIAWINYLSFIWAGILLVKHTDFLNREYKKDYYFVIGGSILLLLVNFVFVEVIPLSIFAKLRFGKTIPFTQLLIFIVLSIFAQRKFKERNILSGILLLVVPLLPRWGGIILLFWTVSLLILRNRMGSNFWKAFSWIFAGILLSYVLLTFDYPYGNPILGFMRRSVGYIFLFLILAIPFFFEKLLKSTPAMRLLIPIFAFGSCIFFATELSGKLPSKLSGFLGGRIQTYIIRDADWVKVAFDLRRMSKKEALVLVPPSLAGFGLYSERSVLVDFKNFPFTDQGMKEWKSRMESVLGSPLSALTSWREDIWRWDMGALFKSREADLDALFSRRSGLDLLNVARKYNVDYILTKSAWHQDLDADVIAKQGSWLLYQVKN